MILIFERIFNFIKKILFFKLIAIYYLRITVLDLRPRLFGFMISFLFAKFMQMLSAAPNIYFPYIYFSVQSHLNTIKVRDIQFY